MSLVLLADVKRHLNVGSPDDDIEIQSMIDASEASIAQILNAGSTLAVQAITQRAAGRSATLVLTHAPVVSVTSVTGSLSGALTLSDLDVDLEHGLICYSPFQSVAFWDPFYTVVYQAGYTVLTLPPDLVLAVKELTRHLWTTQRGGSNRPAHSVDPISTSYSFPNRVLELVNNYTVSGFA